MAHNHSHSHKKNSGLTTAFWLNACFSVIEVAGGIYTNSTAILTDALHDFGDTLAIGIGILLEKISGKKRTQNFSYGYKRFSLLSAFLLSLFLLGGSVVMLVKAGFTLADPQEVNSTGMLWLAVLGIAVNGIAFLRIKRSGGADHGHHHHHNGADHDHSNNSKAIMLHLLEDVMGWAAVLVGSVVIYYTRWYWVDPLLSIGIALFILYNAGKNLVHTMRIFLQAVPENINLSQLTNQIMELEEVQDVHDLHVWTLDGSYHVGTLHVVIEKGKLAIQQQIRDKVEQIMKSHAINHPTLQIETVGAHCQLSSC